MGSVRINLYILLLLLFVSNLCYCIDLKPPSEEIFTSEDVELKETAVTVGVERTPTTAAWVASPTPDYCIEYGVKYYQMFIINYETSRYIDCESKCGFSDYCRGWAFNTREKTCDIYTGDLDEYTFSKNTDVVSSLRHCVGCRAKNIGISGRTFMSIGGVVAELRCYLLCNESSMCKYFHYDSNDEICELKEDALGQYITNDSSISSGPRQCNNETPKPTGSLCGEWGVRYLGGTRVGAHSYTNAISCANACNEYGSTCAVWSYNVSNYDCKLYDAKLGFMSEIDSDYISGPRKCMDCIKKGVGIYGNTFQTTRFINSALVCYQQCQFDSRCYFFEYNADTKSCEFKTKDAGRYLSSNKSITSGHRECNDKNSDTFTVLDYKKSLCLKNNTVYFAQVIEETTMDTAIDCLKRCEKVRQCMAMSFNLRSGNCQIFRTNGKTKTSTLDGIITAFKDCAINANTR